MYLYYKWPSKAHKGDKRGYNIRVRNKRDPNFFPPKIMKFLKPSNFIESIEYTSEKVLRILGFRKPQPYRLSASQLTDARYNFKPKGLPSV